MLLKLFRSNSSKKSSQIIPIGPMRMWREFPNRLNLEKSKVYKWNWDQKKKLNILPSKVYALEIPEGKIYIKGDSNSKIKV